MAHGPMVFLLKEHDSYMVTGGVYKEINCYILDLNKIPTECRGHTCVGNYSIRSFAKTLIVRSWLL